MKELFGDDIFKKAQVSQSKDMDDLRKNKLLGVSRNTGILSSASSLGAAAAIKTNTFFGK